MRLRRSVSFSANAILLDFALVKTVVLQKSSECRLAYIARTSGPAQGGPVTHHARVTKAAHPADRLATAAGNERRSGPFRPEPPHPLAQGHTSILQQVFSIPL